MHNINESICKVLLEKGADISIRNKDNESATVILCGLLSYPGIQPLCSFMYGMMNREELSDIKKDLLKELEGQGRGKQAEPQSAIGKFIKFYDKATLKFTNPLGSGDPAEEARRRRVNERLKTIEIAEKINSYFDKVCNIDASAQPREIRRKFIEFCREGGKYPFASQEVYEYSEPKEKLEELSDQILRGLVNTYASMNRDTIARNSVDNGWRERCSELEEPLLRSFR